MNILNRGAILRLYMSLEILCRVLIGLIDERSLLFQMTDGSGVFGWSVMTATCFLAFLALVDTISNDFIPHMLRQAQPLTSTALNMRHLVYMGLAYCYAFHVVLAFRVQAFTVIPYFVLSVVFLTVAAFADVRTRYCALYVAATRRELGRA